MKQSKRIIISGGGTGGHVFPAIAIADALKRIDTTTNILFVGAKNKMEMDKVPAAGYPIKGLEIQGFQRKSWIKNLLLPFKVIISVLKAIRIIQKFKPNAVVGVGGYASFPVLLAAKKMGIPYLIQEQNSFAGMVNKYLGKKAKRICVAFEHMESFFPSEKILLTGNPIRRKLLFTKEKKEEAFHYFKLSANKKTLLVLGGSLGAHTLNQSILTHLEAIHLADIQIIWQTGAAEYSSLIKAFNTKDYPTIKIVEFLTDMDVAYQVADVIISRAGAGTIAELCVVGKPVILVPSPHVAEDHQTKNALALIKQKAALLINDQDAQKHLIQTAFNLINDQKKCASLSKNITQLAKPNADEAIAHEIFKIAS